MAPLKTKCILGGSSSTLLRSLTSSYLLLNINVNQSPPKWSTWTPGDIYRDLRGVYGEKLGFHGMRMGVHESF